MGIVVIPCLVTQAEPWYTEMALSMVAVLTSSHNMWGSLLKRSRPLPVHVSETNSSLVYLVNELQCLLLYIRKAICVSRDFVDDM